MVFCARCGAQMEEGTHYCPSCGGAVAQAGDAGRLSGAPGATGGPSPSRREDQPVSPALPTSTL